MGFYFRKSKSFGPIRLNLSKSGMGVSTGVKGARVSFGPRGTYLNLGKSGIYYRKKLGSKSKRGTGKYSTTSRKSQPTPGIDASDRSETINAVLVESNALSESIFVSDVNRKLTIIGVACLLWIILSVCSFIWLKYWGFLFTLVSGIFYWCIFALRVDYALESNVGLEWEKFTTILSSLRKSKKVWIVESRTRNTNRKVNAGAASNVGREVLKVRVLKPNRRSSFFLRSNESAVELKNTNYRILFLPSGVVIGDKRKIRVATYDQIRIASSAIDFIEHGTVPQDAEVVRNTWQYVNKDGSPDRRYNGNSMIPVCRYGTLSITGVGVSVELQVSNTVSAANIGRAFDHYKAFYSSNQGLSENHISASSRISENDKPAKRIPANTMASSKQEEELRDILEKMNETVRDLGKDAYIEIFRNPFKINVRFIDGQVYQGHALILYETDTSIEETIPAIEQGLNLNTNTPHVIEIVDERRILLHVYMEVYSEVKNALPLSKELQDAVLKAAERKKKDGIAEKTVSQSISEESEYDDVIAAGASLFSGEDNKANAEDDPYGNLFSTEEDKASPSDDPVEGLFDFFSEE